jgi:hypothetical protein
LPLLDMPITYRCAVRAEAATRTSGEMGNRHRRPRTRSLRLWYGRKGRFGITLYGIKNGRGAQVTLMDATRQTLLLEGSVLDLEQPFTTESGTDHMGTIG